MINNDLPKIARHRKLTADDHRMYDEKRNRNPPYEELGKKYGLDPSLASRICRAIQRKRKEPRLPYKRPHDAKPVNTEIRYSGHRLTNSQIEALYRDERYRDASAKMIRVGNDAMRKITLEWEPKPPFIVEIFSHGQAVSNDGNYGLVGWK